MLNRTPVALNLSALRPARNEGIEAKLTGLLGEAIPVARWSEFFGHLRALVAQWDRLPFTMQPQQQTNWCWAAISTSVALFYSPASGWTQCAVANAQTGRSDCCNGERGGACNVYGFLDQALTTVGHLANATAGTETFETVSAEITAGRPLCIRVQWGGGPGAHFLSIIGFLAQDQNYAIADSIYGNSDVSYATIVSGYQGSGTWTHSYFTQ